MRVAMLQVDWKEDFDEEVVLQACDEVSDGRIKAAYVREFVQDEVDAKVMFVSSTLLTDKQCERLWRYGDLMLGDKTYWEASSFDVLLADVRRHCMEMEAAEKEEA